MQNATLRLTEESARKSDSKGDLKKKNQSFYEDESFVWEPPAPKAGLANELTTAENH